MVVVGCVVSGQRGHERVRESNSPNLQQDGPAILDPSTCRCNRPRCRSGATVLGAVRLRCCVAT